MLSHLLVLVEPAAMANDFRVQMLAQELFHRGYTRAELLLVRQRLPFDPKASHAYGRGFSLADAERVVTEHRTMRARLRTRVTERVRDELLAAYPELDPKDFGHVGWDDDTRKVYVYLPFTTARAHAPRQLTA